MSIGDVRPLGFVDFVERKEGEGVGFGEGEEALKVGKDVLQNERREESDKGLDPERQEVLTSDLTSFLSVSMPSTTTSR